MKSQHHALLGAAVGAVAALLPDAALYCFGWRRDWLPGSHPLVRAHRVLHSPWSVVAAAAVAGWASHVVADRYSQHSAPPLDEGSWRRAASGPPISSDVQALWRHAQESFVRDVTERMQASGALPAGEFTVRRRTR